MIPRWVRPALACCLMGVLLAPSAGAHSLELVPSDSPIYQDLSRLASQGWVPLWATSARPLTRLEIARMLARALDRLDAMRPRRPATADLATLERLVLEFAQELPFAGYRVVEPPQGPSAQAITGWGYRLRRVFVGRLEGGVAPWFETPTPTGSQLRIETSPTWGRGPGLVVSARVQQPLLPQATPLYVDRVYASFGVFGALGREVANGQIGTMTHWWGPGGRGAFLLSDNAVAPETLRITTEGPRLRLVKLLAPLSVANQRYMYAMRTDWLATNTLRVGFSEAMVTSGDVYLPYVFAPFPLVSYAVGLWVRQPQGISDSYNAALDFDWRIGEGTVFYGEIYADKIASGGSPYPSTGGATAGLFFANLLTAGQVDLRLEHSRATNWIYATPGGTNNYIRLGKAMGHWCAPNCELWSAEMSYRPTQQSTLRAGYDLVKRGVGVLGQPYTDVGPTVAWTNLYLSGVVETTQAWHLRMVLTPEGPLRHEVGFAWWTASNAGNIAGATQQNWYGWWEARYEW